MEKSKFSKSRHIISVRTTTTSIVTIYFTGGSLRSPLHDEVPKWRVFGNNHWHTPYLVVGGADNAFYASNGGKIRFFP